jgi:uncharacterized protein YcaQ
VDLLWRALREHEVFEYWGHVASFLPIEDWPLMRHRMSAEREWRAIRRLREEAPGYIEAIYDTLEERGPLTTSDLDDPGERKGPWWGWADGKHVLEWLFMTGRAAVADRRNFTRYYDIAQRVIPPRFFDAPAVPEEEAMRTLLMRAAERMAVGTATGLIDYYRLQMTKTTHRPREVVKSLVAAGRLVEVEVEGMRGPTFMHPEARIPRAVEARALLNPFDPIVWFRDRTEHLYGFDYRIEIYTPRAKREYGYYVFPFLLGDELVGRADIKADRKESRLLVPGAFLEPGQDPRRVAREMAVELEVMAGWLDLSEIVVGRRGNLSAALRAAVGR